MTTHEAAAANQPDQDKAFWTGEWANTEIEPPDASTWANERDRMLMEIIRPLLPPGPGTVAELGCGSGRLLARVGLDRPDLQLIGIDYDAEALRLVQHAAKAYGVPLEARLGDVQQLDFPDHSFDMVLSGGLLEHFKDPVPALREMVRTLKPGGTFYSAIVPRKLISLHRPLHRILGPQVYRTRHDAYAYANWLRELGMIDVVPLTKGVYPPLFYRLPPGPRGVIERAGRKLDGTRLADLVGYFFVVTARRPW